MSLPGASIRRGVRWTVAILAALSLLVAFGVRARSIDATGVRSSLDGVRLAAAALLAAGAVVARARASRAEVAALGLAAGALALAVVVDRAGLTWAPSASAAFRGSGGLAAATSAVALGLPLLVGCLVLRVSASDLLGSPARPVGSLLAAGVAGVLLYPGLSLLATTAEHLIRLALGPTAGTSGLSWPGIRAAVLRDPFPSSAGTLPRQVVVEVAVVLPLLEAFLHGALRQATLRWGALPFVVGTAFLGALLRGSTGVDFLAFGGTLITGWLAARSGSILPGLAFWASLFLGWVAWGSLVPPG